MELTAEEKAIGDKAILKFERQARNWRKRLLFPLVVGLISLVWGSIVIFDGLQSLYESKDDKIQRYVDEAEQLPNGTERDVWMVGTFRKAAIILEMRFELYKVTIMNMTMGLLAIPMGIFAMVFSVLRWNKGPEQRLIAKFLRAKWEEEISDSANTE
jgi:hypothetical protein